MKYATQSNVIYLTHPTFNFELFLMRVVVALSRANMTYYDLAHRANLSETTVCRIMGRRAKNMYVGTLAKISQALHVSSDYLLGVKRAATLREREIEQETQYNLRQQRRRDAV